MGKLGSGGIDGSDVVDEPVDNTPSGTAGDDVGYDRLVVPDVL